MKVKFLPMGKEIEITSEKTLLQGALENGVDIKSICKGKLICAECRVKVVEGENNLLPPSRAELNLIGTSWQLDGRRFACQMRCFGDVTVDLTEQLQRAESARKNIRGFKSSRPATESVAVVDTMILVEKPEISDEAAGKPAREAREGGGGGGREGRGGGRGERGERGGGGGGQKGDRGGQGQQRQNPKPQQQQNRPKPNPNPNPNPPQEAGEAGDDAESSDESSPNQPQGQGGGRKRRRRRR